MSLERVAEESSFRGWILRKCSSRRGGGNVESAPLGYALSKEEKNPCFCRMGMLRFRHFHGPAGADRNCVKRCGRWEGGKRAFGVCAFQGREKSLFLPYGDFALPSFPRPCRSGSQLREELAFGVLHALRGFGVAAGSGDAL